MSTRSFGTFPDPYEAARGTDYDPAHEQTEATPQEAGDDTTEVGARLVSRARRRRRRRTRAGIPVVRDETQD